MTAQPLTRIQAVAAEGPVENIDITGCDQLTPLDLTDGARILGPASVTDQQLAHAQCAQTAKAR